MKRPFIIFGGVLIGLIIGYFLSFNHSSNLLPFRLGPGEEVLGFLPYWLTNKAQSDYSKYINTLSYFSLTIDDDGHIKKLNNPQEEEPGWVALHSGRMDPFFQSAKAHNVALSLTVFSGSSDSIYNIISSPPGSAQNLASDVLPLIKQYGFSDLNLDVESSRDASDEAREKFSLFAESLKNDLKGSNTTLTVDISPSDLIKKHLINPKDMLGVADKVLVMAYDYHYTGSAVTGPVSPLNGAGVMSEYDASTAIEKALVIFPSSQILLGLPLYGYEWETLKESTASATIPGTGLIASNKRVEDFLEKCSSCSATMDPTFEERHITYLDTDTQTFHQIFYPDKDALSAKLEFARDKNLGGVGLWALGYEGGNILDPLSGFK